MGLEDTLAALRAAFDALLPLADPQRQAAVLRTALKALLDDEAGTQVSRPIRESPFRHQRKQQEATDFALHAG